MSYTEEGLPVVHPQIIRELEQEKERTPGQPDVEEAFEIFDILRENEHLYLFMERLSKITGKPAVDYRIFRAMTDVYIALKQQALENRIQKDFLGEEPIEVLSDADVEKIVRVQIEEMTQSVVHGFRTNLSLISESLEADLHYLSTEEGIQKIYDTYASLSVAAHIFNTERQRMEEQWGSNHLAVRVLQERGQEFYSAIEEAQGQIVELLGYYINALLEK